MIPFDPHHPHGHVTRGDGRKMIVHAVLKSGMVIASAENGSIGGTWCRDGRWTYEREHNFDLLNAPAPKRTWEVVAVEYSDGSIGFWNTEYPVPTQFKIIGRWFGLTEGEGMEEKDG